MGKEGTEEKRVQEVYREVGKEGTGEMGAGGE